MDPRLELIVGVRAWENLYGAGSQWDTHGYMAVRSRSSVLALQGRRRFGSRPRPHHRRVLEPWLDRLFVRGPHHSRPAVTGMAGYWATEELGLGLDRMIETEDLSGTTSVGTTALRVETLGLDTCGVYCGGGRHLFPSTLRSWLSRPAVSSVIPGNTLSIVGRPFNGWNTGLLRNLV
jgi:hypothetical protein